jgi:SAM-dependent methyltransferase
MEPIVDRELATWRKKRAANVRKAGAGFLLARALDELEERLSAVKRDFTSAAAIHCGWPEAVRFLATGGHARDVLRIEDPALLDAEGGAALAAPGETVPVEPARLDLAVSLYALHEMNDVPGMLIQIRRALRPDGLFLGCMAGAGTLGELRESLLRAETALRGGAGPRVLPFADVREAGALLQRAGFALPVADVDTVTVRYDTMFDLMGDLRAMGATSSLIARSRTPASRRLFVEAARIYAENFSDPDGRIRATFSTIWLSGWAPAPTQPKPLAPGSARVSLAEALGTQPPDDGEQPE